MHTGMNIITSVSQAGLGPASCSPPFQPRVPINPRRQRSSTSQKSVSRTAGNAVAMACNLHYTLIVKPAHVPAANSCLKMPSRLTATASKCQSRDQPCSCCLGSAPLLSSEGAENSSAQGNILLLILIFIFKHASELPLLHEYLLSRKSVSSMNIWQASVRYYGC